MSAESYPSRNQLREAAEILESAGFFITAKSELGLVLLSPSEVIEFHADEVSWLIKDNGVPREVCVKWISYRRSGYQCTGTSSKREQCKCRGAYDPALEAFVPGFSDRCKDHVDRLSARAYMASRGALRLLENPAP